MSQVKIGQFVFDPNTSQLVKDNQTVTLDPKQLKLLEFFLLHPQRIISRDELQKAIWQNTIVADNTINKLVATMRKIFGDTAQSSRYIQTVPKQGYRFIASICQQEAVQRDLEPLVEQKKSQVPVQSIPKKALFFSAFTLILLIIISVQYSIQDTENQQSGYSEPLTRITGNKLSPISDNSGLYGYFVNKTDKVTDLWQIKLDKRTHAEPVKLSFNDLQVEKLVGFTENNELVFQGKQNQQCAWFLADINQQSVNIIQQFPFACKELIIRNSVLINEKVYSLTFIDKNSGQSQFIRTDLNSGTSQPLNLALPQNEIARAINYSTQYERLLIVTHNRDGRSHFYEITDLNSPVISKTLLFSLDYLVYQGIWSHQADTIVYDDSPPSSRLIQRNINSHEITQVVSSENYICCDSARVNQSNNYLFVTHMADYQLSTNLPQLVVENSSIYDIAPALSHDVKKLFFVSKRSGKAQIYVSTKGKTTQLTQFKQPLRLRQLAISFDDQVLLASDSNRLWSISSDGELLHEPLAITFGIKKIAWLSDNLFAIHHQTNHGISIFNRNLNKLMSLPKHWQSITADKVTNKIYLVDEARNLYETTLADMIVTSTFKATPLNIEIAKPTNILISAGILYQASKQDNGLIKQTLSTGATERLTHKMPFAFDVFGAYWVVSEKMYEASEVHITRNQ